MNNKFHGGQVLLGREYSPSHHLQVSLLRRQVLDCTSWERTPTSAGRRITGGITEADMATLQWVKPTTVVEKAFVEGTADGLLRHSQFVAVRDDKRPSEVRREKDTS